MSKVTCLCYSGIWCQKIRRKEPLRINYRQAERMLRYLRLWWKWKHLSWRIGQHHQGPRHWKPSPTNHRHCPIILKRWGDGFRSFPWRLRIQWRWKQWSLPRPTFRILRCQQARSFRSRGIRESRCQRWRELLSCWSWPDGRLCWQGQRWSDQLWRIR